MGEIRSTLDLVMERTRHLSMSEEDRVRQKRADFKKRLQGLLQRYDDGDLSVAAFLEKFAGLRSKLALEEDEILYTAVLNRIDPEKNNDGWLKLLEGFRPKSWGPLRDALGEYREKRIALRRKAEEDLLKHLFRNSGISGSAVMPNTRKDPGYREALAALQTETKSTINAISAGQRQETGK